MSEPGKLITFEGIDHAGKGTQIALAMEYLQNRGIAIEQNREPGGTLYGESLRLLLKHPQESIPALFEKFAGHSDCPDVNLTKAITANDFFRSPECELMMFAAARAEYARKILEPQLSQGISVISDRLMDSTRAYQGGGHFGGEKEVVNMIQRVNHFVMNGVWPHLTIFIDIPVEVMMERGRKESDEKNAYFERLGQRFFERVRTEYLKIAGEEPERFIVINGHQPISRVFVEVKDCLNYLFGLN